MVRFALIGAVVALALGSAVVFAGWMIAPTEPKYSAFDAIATRFPAEWTIAPSEKPKEEEEIGTKPAPATMSQVEMSVADLIAALDAVDRQRMPVEPERSPTSPDAVFNDGQIAAIKTRLSLTAEQEPHWPEVEAALRNIVWERKRGSRLRTLDTASVERLKNAAARLARTFTPRQKSEVRLLANIVGLKIDL